LLDRQPGIAMKRRGALLLCAGLLTWGTTAYAYTFLVAGVKWPTPSVQYYINPATSDMPEADVVAAIQAAANAWVLEAGANIQPSYRGKTTRSTVAQNGTSDVFFREESNGTTYAQTYVWWNGSNQLIEADMILYGGSVTFFAAGSACAGTAVYLQDAATHEFGHAFGLGHSDISGTTMYPTMSWCSTYVRTLEPDDIAGIRALYPPTTPAPRPPTNVRITR
jgi:hypothetical protein